MSLAAGGSALRSRRGPGTGLSEPWAAEGWPDSESHRPQAANRTYLMRSHASTDHKPKFLLCITENQSPEHRRMAHDLRALIVERDLDAAAAKRECAAMLAREA